MHGCIAIIIRRNGKEKGEKNALTLCPFEAQKRQTVLLANGTSQRKWVISWRPPRCSITSETTCTFSPIKLMSDKSRGCETKRDERRIERWWACGGEHQKWFCHDRALRFTIMRVETIIPERMTGHSRCVLSGVRPLGYETTADHRVSP